MTILGLDELESNYNTTDPWGYQTNPADHERKQIIIDNVAILCVNSALDIGCGEGWITKDLPVKEIYGYEVSKQARSRWAPNIKQWELSEKVDLTLLTGVLYENYFWHAMVTRAVMSSRKYILTSCIADREYPPAISFIQTNHFKQIEQIEFPYYRSDTEQFTQRLRIFEREY